MFLDQPFTSHSGLSLTWKVECDQLTKEDWRCIAKVVADGMAFKKVIGIPYGGTLFAEALKPYCDDQSTYILIVDDVLTTGKSMEEVKEKLLAEDPDLRSWMIRGLVLYSRALEVPFWIVPFWQLFSGFIEEGEGKK